MSEQLNQDDFQKLFFESLDNFKEAVYNGQVRLALEHLLPVIDGIVNALSSESEESIVEVDENTQPKPVTASKKTVKEEKADIQEV